MVMPLHSDIQIHCRKLGFDNLNPILWYKIANVNYEANHSSSFLGKPYEPNGIVKNDMEYILMMRKPGGYRNPTEEQREQSRIDPDDYNKWFTQIWTMPGASTKKHPAPFPMELADRLVRMFSFYGDTVLDPFCGSGTTMVAAENSGRNSIAIDVEENYCRQMARRMKRECKEADVRICKIKKGQRQEMPPQKKTRTSVKKTRTAAKKTAAKRTET